MRQGFCMYCNEGRLVDIPDDAGQEAADQEATAQCSCEMAEEARRKKCFRDRCQEKIHRMFNKDYPDIEDLFYLFLDGIENGKIQKVTVVTCNGRTAKMVLTASGQIRIGIEEKHKKETLL